MLAKFLNAYLVPNLSQVKVGDLVCKGTGPNKKLAKRAAADAMLLELGYSRPPPGTTKPSNGKEQRKVRALWPSIFGSYN